ncbi:MAG: phosphatidate cytidylyltransferase [Clostridiales bacterium]|nr:phosphatidate cytidylyltransferase [Clostridiales bacterium]MDK2932322.1 phosphatidate cytidylyltransferase [Clostridiales bacterium]
MLAKRIISAVVGVILLICIVISDKIVINIGVAAISMIALYELFSAVKCEKNLPLMGISWLGAIVISFSNFIRQELIMILIYGYILLLFLFYLIFHSTIRFSRIAINFFALIYIPYFLSHIIFTRGLNNGNVLVWLIFLGAWTTDTFAFFVGTFVGKRKLWPEVSPKKTIEGAIGGIMGCGLSFLLYGYLLHIWGNYNINYANLFILGLLCSFIAQIGDLSASIIKRQYHIKDFGKIMPGHGGVLDRFDSIIFVAPLVYYFTACFNVIF